MQIVIFARLFGQPRRTLSPIVPEMTRAPAADKSSSDFTFGEPHQASGAHRFGRLIIPACVHTQYQVNSLVRLTTSESHSDFPMVEIRVVAAVDCNPGVISLPCDV